MAACLALGPAAIAYHRRAAALWRLDGIEQGAIEVLHRTTGHGRAQKDRPPDSFMPRSDTTRLGMFPLTTVIRTLLDLGSVVDEEQLEAAFESAYRRGLTDPERARRRLRSRGTRGNLGPAALKKVLAARDRRSRQAASWK